ncbi:hypothetical protein [Neolewinella maritima]|uniref:hypothetical protein n=1 Tax=Neolewinella maritima TaxID=1383882 RepID=UPI001EE9A66A|nr:hypothetical protein [Neolewinella maritima]
MTKPIDHQELKDALRELFIEEPGLIVSALQQLKAEAAQQEASKSSTIGEGEIRKLVAQDFQELDAVFRALA